MYVCICNQVTDREIHGAARLGVSTMDELAETLGVGTCCGQCRDCAKQVLAEAVMKATKAPEFEPVEAKLLAVAEEVS